MDEIKKEAPKKFEAQKEEKDDGLVVVEKDGRTLRVHPTCVKAHVTVGWKLRG